jgi:SAM-dependent methyltransferase
VGVCIDLGRVPHYAEVVLLDATSRSASQVDGPVTPEPILKLALGFMASKQLFVANELGLFKELGQGPSTLDALAMRMSVPKRALRIVMDAMVSLGLVECEDDYYENGAAAAAYLTGSCSEDLRPLLKQWNRLSYPAWQRLESVVRGRTLSPREAQHASRAVSDGMEVLNVAAARALAHTYDFGHHRRILDLGGGTGRFLAVILKEHSIREATLFDVPPVAPRARKRLRRQFPNARIDVVEGDFFVDPIPQGHDVVLLTNVVHLFSPERNRELLRRIRWVVPPGTRLLLVDAWTNGSRTPDLGIFGEPRINVLKLNLALDAVAPQR